MERGVNQPIRAAVRSHAGVNDDARQFGSSRSSWRHMKLVSRSIFSRSGCRTFSWQPARLDPSPRVLD